MRTETEQGRVDVAAEVVALCQKFNLEPTLVAKIEVFPTHAVITSFKTNDDGAKYVDPVTGEAAVEFRYVDIKT